MEEEKNKLKNWINELTKSCTKEELERILKYGLEEISKEKEEDENGTNN